MSTVYIRFSIRPEAPQPVPQRDLQRAPMLERLLAQASPPQTGAEWRSDAYRVIGTPASPMPDIAPVVLVASRGRSAAAFTCLATPLQLAAGMSSVTLSSAGALTLEASDALRLADDFNRQFSDSGARLSVGRGAVVLCEFDRLLHVSTHDPEQLVGRDLFDTQPAGADGGRLRRLMSEMEMWLFDHPVNRERAARALPPVSSLWLWGGGIPLQEMPVVQGWTAGNDPFFSAFGALQEFPSDARAGVLVTTERPGEPAWAEVERKWLGPALAALRAQRLKRIELSVGSQRLLVERPRWWSWRGASWRRARPWWEACGAILGENVES